MQLTVFVLAAENGVKQERWASFMKCPKQFIEVMGEALIHRTLRLCGLHFKCDIHLLAINGLYDSLPVIKLVPESFATKAHSVLSVLDEWKGGDLVVLYSDVYYSDAAFQCVLHTPGTHFFGRAGRSAFTFKNYGELFALRVAWDDKDYLSEMLHVCVDNYGRTGQQSFWALYRLMAGFPVDKHRVESRLFIEMHDETDDIDFPQDVQRIVDAVEKRPKWRIRFWLRRASLWNKQRRDRVREKRSQKQR